MISMPRKFVAVLLGKCKHSHNKQIVKTQDKTVKPQSQIILLGITSEMYIRPFQEYVMKPF